MFYSTNIFTAVIVALAAAKSANALGCFSGGLTYGDVSANNNDIANARTNACNNLQGSYAQGGSRDFCANFPATGNRINFSVKNNAGTTQTLSASDCAAALTIEMNACSHGSNQNHGSFNYEDDPNAGSC